MKRVALSSIIISLVITTITISSIAMKDELSDERIYVEDGYFNGKGYWRDFVGYIKAEELEPGSSLLFVYPYSKELEYGNKLFRTYQLVRLPSWRGGDINDATAFRAYSIMSIDIQNCLVRYWNDKERLEDPCSGSVYRIEDGYGYQGPVTLNKQPQRALPKLDIGIDEEGYLYVKKPIFDIMHNGIIQYGRYLPDDKIINASKRLLDNFIEFFEDKYGYKPNIPLKTYDNKVLINIDMYIVNDRYDILYENIHNDDTAIMNISYCNCSYTLEDIVLKNRHNDNIDILKLDDRYVHHIDRFYRFTDKGFEILTEEPIIKDLVSRMEKVSLEHTKEELISIIKNSKEYELLSNSIVRINDVKPNIGKAVLSSTKVVDKGKLMLDVYIFVDPANNVYSHASCIYETDNRTFYKYTTNNVLDFIENPPCL